MGNFREAISYFNPLLFYYAGIYGISKIYETTYGLKESVWQTIWNKYIDIVGDDEGVNIVWVLNLFIFVVYWGLGAIFYTMQKLKIPKSLDNFKIQAKESEIDKGENFSHVVKVVLKNMFVGLLLSIVFFYYQNNWLNVHVTRELPEFSTVMRDLLVCFFCQEFFFYYSHRLLHYKWFYTLHKKHHEFVTPVCLTAMYADTIEHIFSNIIPVVIGFKFMGCHMATAFLWILHVLITTLNDHSGYHLPFLHSSQLHDYHHLKFNVNFSVYGFLDLLHGTYGHFKTSGTYEKHRTLWSFTPIDAKKK